MQPYLGAVGGHSKCLLFRFTLDSDNQAEMHYKKFSTMPWEPEGVGVCVLSVRVLHVPSFRLMNCYCIIGLS